MVNAKPPVALPLNILETYQGSVSSSGKNVFDLPAGTLTLTDFWVGTQKYYVTVVKKKETTIKTSSLKVALYFDIDGSGNNLQLIDTIYTSKATYHHVLTNNNVFTCTKKSRIIVHQWIYGESGARETYVRYQGIVQ